MAQDIGSGRVGDGFVHQHDRNSVPNRVDAAALGALQTLSFVFQRQRLFAHRAHQDVEQVLGNHGKILRFLCQLKNGKNLTAKDEKEAAKDAAKDAKEQR